MRIAHKELPVDYTVNCINILIYHPVCPPDDDPLVLPCVVDVGRKGDGPLVVVDLQDLVNVEGHIDVDHLRTRADAVYSFFEIGIDSLERRLLSTLPLPFNTVKIPKAFC